MWLTEEGLNKIEHQADKMKDVNLMFLVQILKEMREIKGLLEVHQNSCDSGYNSSSSTDDSKNKHG